MRMHRHSTATLMGLTKRELVEYVRIAEHNRDVAEETLKQQAENVKDWMPVVHGRWEDVKETSLYVPDMKYTVTHTAETCSACKVRIGFIGSKPYLYDNICPNCGAKMDGERRTNAQTD